MSWVAVGSAVVGTALQYKGQKDAAKAQQQGINQAGAVQQQALAQTRSEMQPYMELGSAGTNGLMRLLADPNSIQDSAAYQWRQQQGLQGLDRSAAARGGLWSGGADADRMQYASGLASQEYGDQWNRLMGLTQQGQNATTALGNFGQGYAANQSNLAVDGANARASGYQNQANTLGQLAYGAGGAFSDWYQGNKANNPGGTGWYLGNNPGRG